MGIAAFFPKPFDLGLLVRHVKDLLAFAPTAGLPDPSKRARELGQVVGDLGNAMSLVLGSVELLADPSAAASERLAVTETALAAAQRASALVRRLSHLVGDLT
jgi:hypothetical protein